MAQAETGNKVRVHYSGRLEDGLVFDSSEGQEPLEFTIGQGQMLPGFEQEVIGMVPGETRIVKIPAQEAYGPYRPQGVVTVPRSQMPAEMALEPGMMVHGNKPEGGSMPFTVVEVTESEITLDANHPMAGKDLTFEIQLVDIG